VAPPAPASEALIPGLPPLRAACKRKDCVPGLGDGRPPDDSTNLEGARTKPDRRNRVGEAIMRKMLRGIALAGAMLSAQDLYAADPGTAPLPPVRSGEIIDFVAPPPLYTK